MITEGNQRTLASSFSIKGVGLHTGRKCQAVIKPAPENAGIVFKRVDLPDNPEFKAIVENVVDVIRGTTLGSGEAKVYTIEHVLSALVGLGIDNALVELDDNEPPVADGSAKDFVEGIKKAGIVEQGVAKKVFSVSEPFEYQANKTLLRIEPSDHFEVHCEIDYSHPLLKNLQFKFSDPAQYEKEIAPARTYCFDYEIEALKKKGLAKGGSLENAIVIGPSGVYNGASFLRFEDEFIRHKILDLMGDLALVGAPIKGKITAKRCGHGHNVNFLRALKEKFAPFATLSNP